MTSNVSERGSEGILWRFVVAIACLLAFLLFTLLYETCAPIDHSVSGGNASCRHLSWQDPPLAIAAALVAVSIVGLLGVKLASISWGNAAVEFAPSAQVSRGEGSTFQESSGPDLDDAVVDLILLGAAAAFPSNHAFLFAFYQVKDSAVSRYWYSTTHTPRRPERSVEAVAGSSEMFNQAVTAHAKQRTEQLFVTPFPDQNIHLRLCLLTPVNGKAEAAIGVLGAVALQNGDEEMPISPQLLRHHLEKCADALGAALGSVDAART